MNLARTLLAGVVLVVGLELGRRLADPYAEPRLTIAAWLKEVTS